MKNDGACLGKARIAERGGESDKGRDLRSSPPPPTTEDRTDGVLEYRNDDEVLLPGHECGQE